MQERAGQETSRRVQSVTRLQIVQASDVLKVNWLDRALLEPTLMQQTGGLWMLTVRRQGAYGSFDVPYIGSELVLADAQADLVVVLISYHGSVTEKYGRLGYLTQKGQFYRYYWQQPSGSWEKVAWVKLSDEQRSLILATLEAHGPSWARKPGKLHTERKPPTKPVTMTSYKVVRVIDGRYFSLYDPSVEHVLGERKKQPAKPRYGGGFYSYPVLEQARKFLANRAESIPFHTECVTTHVALLECEVGGRIVAYGHKIASTFLCPVRVLAVHAVTQQAEGDTSA